MPINTRVDLNASSLDRDRRNWQRIKKGGLTEFINVANPITNNGSTIGLLIDPAGALSTSGAGLGVRVDNSTTAIVSDNLAVKVSPTGGLQKTSTGLATLLGTVSTVISTGVGGIDLRLESSTTIFAGPATGAAATPTFRALSTFVDNSTIIVTSTGVLQASTAGGGGSSTSIIAADASILVGTSTGSTTLRVQESSTGAISTGGAGVFIRLADVAPGSTLALSIDFTTLSTGTQVGTIGGSGSTFWVTNNTSQFEIPNNTQANTAMLIGSTGAAFTSTASGAAQAQYVPAITGVATGSHYLISTNASVNTLFAGGVAGTTGLTARLDKVSHTASQGIALVVWRDLVRLVDMTAGGTTIASATITPNLTSGVFYPMTLEINGNAISGSVSTTTLSGTNANFTANTGVGFFTGSAIGNGEGVKNFQVWSILNSSTFSGLFTNSTGLGIIADPNSILTTSTGVAVNQAIVPVMTGPWTFAFSGVASSSAMLFTGNLFTGGTSVTTRPLFLMETTGTASSAWATAGTFLGINAPTSTGSCFYIDCQQNGVDKFNVRNDGQVSTAGSIITPGTVICSVVDATANNTTLSIQNRTFNGSSGSVPAVDLVPVYNQTGTAGSIDFRINRTNTAIGSGTHLFTQFLAASATKFQVTALGETNSVHYVGQRPTPANTSIAAGAGAGTSPTVALSTATDSAGIINLTTGSTPSASAVICTVTFALTYAGTGNGPPKVVFAPANANAAALSGSTGIYVVSSTTNFTLNAGPTALAAATVYSWHYHTIG